MQTAETRFLVSNLAGLVMGMMLAAGLVGTAQAAAPGDLDTTFGTNGLVYSDIGTASGDKAYSVAIQSDGKIVVVGSSDNGTDDDFAVVRYTTGGILDTTFGTGGKLTTPIGSSDDIAYSVAIQPDDKIVVAGATFDGVDNDFALTRYTITGTLDTTFGAAGIVTTTISSGDDVAKAIAIQSNDKIVVAGSANDDFAVVRYNSFGSLDDATFGGGDGIMTTDFFGSSDWAHAIAIQTDDGKLVVAGHADIGASDEFAVARYLTNGNLDSTFNGNGKVTTDFIGNSVDQAFSVAIQPDGKIVLAGFVNTGGDGSTDDFAVARYSSTGILDNTFSSDGKVVTPIGSNDDQAYSLAIQPTGKIVVAGFSDNKAPTHQDYSLARYTITGTLDTTFGSTGVVTADLGTINTLNTSADQAYSVAIQADSRILIAGFTDHPAGNDNFAVVRFESPNNIPTVSNVSKAGVEDIDVAFAATDFTGSFSDADSDGLAKIKITSLPANGILKLSSTPVTQNQEVPAADLDNLTFPPNGDWNGATSFGWNGFDGLDYATTGALVTITIASVNDPPTISDISDQMIFVNTSTGPLTFTVGDVETVAASLIVSGESSDQTLVPDGNISFGGGGVTRTVKFTPALNQTGMATITVSVTDDVLTADDTSVLTVEGSILYVPLILRAYL